MHNNSTVQHTKVCFSSSYFAQPGSMDSADEIYWQNLLVNRPQTTVRPGTLSGEPTDISLVALKCHQIGNMTKTPQASLEFGVRQYMTNSTHHHGPHSLSPCCVNRASQLECNGNCNARRSVLQLCTLCSQPIRVLTRISNRFASNKVRHEV